MEGHSEFQGWELLPGVDDPHHPSPRSGEEDGGDPFGLIAADYFVLGPTHEEETSPESTDLNLIVPDSASDQLSTGGPLDSVEETAVGEESVGNEVSSEGSVCSEENGDLSWLDSWGDEIGAVACDLKQDGAKGDVDRSGSEKGDDVLVDGDGEGSGVAWWKVPLELVKLCVFRVRPVWSVSIAAAVVGLIVLGRRLYAMRRASRRIPVAMGLDDKKALQIPAAARLTEAFVALRRVPAIKASLPTTGVTPWPAMALR